MKERPILFSGPMVRAILEGRKTMTRRVVDPYRLGRAFELAGKGVCVGYTASMLDDIFRYDDDTEWAETMCPYGNAGDRLWVRETFCQLVDPETKETKAYYAATDDLRGIDIVDGDGFTDERKDGTPRSPWKPSIHMPRWASRITLEITGVRVERLQAITWEDAEAEGIQCVPTDDTEGSYWCVEPNDERGVADRPDDVFSFLWDSINGRPKLPTNTNSTRYHRIKRWMEKHPPCDWNANPWVWVVSFRRVEQ